MKLSHLWNAALVVILLAGTATSAVAQVLPGAIETPLAAAEQSAEVTIVDSATNVLNEIMAIPAKGIPRSLLRDAEGIAIVPSMIKGAFIVGGRHGRGVVVVRDERGGWRAPSFITITGGSVGWQAGVQATDVVLVFRTKKSIQGLMNGKFTIGAEASAAAGPVGRDASAATDLTLRAEILSYSRARGLFAGAALDGSLISLDNEATANFYRGTGILPGDGPQPAQPRLPASADRLMETILAYTRNEEIPGVTSVASTNSGTLPATGGQLSVDANALRTKLANTSAQMLKLVDDSWQRYLALPAEVYGGNNFPSQLSLDATVNRYAAVAADSQYKLLTDRPEFQQTYELLKNYRDLLTNANPGSTLSLPAPPR